jgi:hypothetical protein
MREVSLKDLPEVDLSTLEDAPAEIGLSDLPEVDLSTLQEEGPSPQEMFGPVVQAPAAPRVGASGSWAPGQGGATGTWSETPAVDHSADMQALLAAARTEGIDRAPAAPDVGAVNLLPASQRATAAKTPGTYIPETQGPLYTPTTGEIAKEEAKGFARGLTAGAVGGPPDPGGGGTVGDVAGSMVTNLVPYLAGPVAGAAVNTYYAYIRDLNEQADRGLTLPDMNQKRALARAAVALAFAKIPGAVGGDAVKKGVTGAAIGSLGNVADVAATQLVEQGKIDPNDPEYGPQYEQAALMGAAIGGPVGAISPSHGKGATHFPEPQDVPETIRVAPEGAPAGPTPEVPLSALPEEAAAPEFDDAAVEAAYTAQYEPAPDAPGKTPAAPAEIPLSALPETEAPPPPKAGDSNVQEEGNQGREALLTPDYQRLAIRIARQHPNLSEEQAMVQAHILQRGDEEAIRRGAGEAVQSRRIEFDQSGARTAPEDAPDVLHVGAAVQKALSDERGTLRVNPADLARLRLQKGEALNPTPMNAREMWKVMGKPVRVDPNAPTLEKLAERMNEGMAVHDEGVVSYRPKANQKILGADLPDADHGYHADDLAAALLDRPRHKSAVEEQIHAAKAEPADIFPGEDERYLSGLDPKLMEGAPRRDKYGELPPAGEPDTFLGDDGQPLFQTGRQRDMFGGEEAAPKGKPKAEQTDMFGSEGLKAGETTLKGGSKGLEETPLQRQADQAAANDGQESLLQERGKVTKGQIEFLDDGSSTIKIFSKHADFSTLMHEYGHWLRRKSLNAAEGEKIQAWLKGQKVKVLDEAGWWTREAEEKFARAFERYLRDRTAPTPELKTVFEKLRQFMRLVYKQAKEGVLGRELPPDIRKVFDDLLGFKGKEDGPQVLRQEGDLTPREKRADLQRKQESTAQPMRLEGDTRPGQAPPKGRPQEPHPGLKGGVQEYTDRRLANPADGPNPRGTAPHAQTTGLGAQQPLSPALHGEANAGKRPPKAEEPTGQTTSMGAQQPLAPGLQGKGEAGKAPPPKTPIKPGDVGGLEARWDVPDETRFDYFLRRIQDKMRPLKLMERAIVKGGRRVLESTDAYLAEELYHGKAGAALRNTDRELVEPIFKAMKAGDVDLQAVDEFLYARHAAERNAQIAKINPDPDRGSGLSDAEAKAILDKAKADGTYTKLEAIGEQVDAMNAKRLEVLEASGLISEETRKTWESAYKHYVPLKGFAEAADTPEAVLDSHLGKGFDMRGPESKRALGRKSLADSPLATSIAQLNESIIRAHKNQVSKTFLKLVLDNPNKDVWEVNKTEFKQAMENGQVVQRQVVNKNDPNVVTAKVLGKEYYVIVKPKYTALAQAMKNMGEEKAGFIVKTLGKVNKVLALINTTLSPEFVLGNFLRDAQTAGINMAGENGSKFAAKVAKDAMPAMRGALQGVRDSKFLTPSKSVEEWTKWYKRYEKAGGKTEYLGLRTVDDIKKEFESKLGKPTTWGKSKEGVKWLGRQIEDINGAVENSIRLSAFKNGVEAGLSEAKAASLAKNLTVNFNRKGELGTLANSLYLFFNANIQGTARIMAAMAKPNTRAGKRLWGIAGGLAASSYGLAEYNRAMAGEDEDGINRYDKIPPFVKERNLIFMLPDSKGKDVQAVTIPIPYGYNVFNVIGESLSSWTHGASGLDGALNIGQALAGAFNPLGSESSQKPAKWLTKMATPTVADPIVQYAMNEAFTGAPIKPENLPYGTPKPASQLAFKSVSPMARAAAEKLNELTGGSDYRSGKVDVSPEALEHFVTSYTGSLGKFLYNTLGYVSGVAQGKPPDVSKTPFARRFFMGENQYFDQKTFADNAREYKPFLEEANHLDGDESKKFESEFGPQIELAQMSASIQKQVEKLNKQAKGIRGDNALSESARDAELKTIDDEKKKLFREFNREVQARKKAPVAVPALP